MGVNHRDCLVKHQVLVIRHWRIKTVPVLLLRKTVRGPSFPDNLSQPRKTIEKNSTAKVHPKYVKYDDFILIRRSLLCILQAGDGRLKLKGIRIYQQCNTQGMVCMTKSHVIIYIFVEYIYLRQYVKDRLALTL